MLRWILASLAAVAVVATGWVHGNWTDRWATDEKVIEASKLLTQIPMQIGDWEGSEIDVKPGQAGPGVTGCIQRTYLNRRTGVSVVIALVNGRPGPVATHTPEVCYGASGYLVGQKQEAKLGEGENVPTFWTSDAIKSKVTEETRLRLFWAWNGGDTWVASPDARQQFSRGQYPVLHKLYVLRELGGPEVMEPRAVGKDEPCKAFLDVLIPTLNEKLFVRQ